MIERPNIEWKDVPGFEGKFKISNYGDLICLGFINKNGKYLPYQEKRFEDSKISNSGYYYTSFSILNHIDSFLHRLVAKCFLGIDNKREDQNDINHKDCNKLNNFVGTVVNNYIDGNLEWCSRRENMIHASNNNLINKDSELRKDTLAINRLKAWDSNKRPIVQLDMDGNFIKEFDCIDSAAKEIGTSPSLISAIAMGKDYHKSVKGFQWVYKEEYNSDKDYHYHNNHFINTKKKVAQYDLQGNLIAIYDSRKEAAKAVNSYDGGYITECCKGKRKTHKGFIWKNVE